MPKQEIPIWMGTGETSRRICFFFSRDPDANPYYTSNQKLLDSCRVSASLGELPGVEVERWEGGHRSGLEEDCRLMARMLLPARLEEDAFAAWADEFAQAHRCQWRLAE